MKNVLKKQQENELTSIYTKGIARMDAEANLVIAKYKMLNDQETLYSKVHKLDREWGYLLNIGTLEVELNIGLEIEPDYYNKSDVLKGFYVELYLSSDEDETPSINFYLNTWGVVMECTQHNLSGLEKDILVREYNVELCKLQRTIKVCNEQAKK